MKNGKIVIHGVPFTGVRFCVCGVGVHHPIEEVKAVVEKLENVMGRGKPFKPPHL